MKIMAEIPKRIKLAGNLMYLSILTGVLNLIFKELFTEESILLEPLAILVTLFTFAGLGLLSYMVKKGKNWARIVSLTLFILGLITYPYMLLKQFDNSLIIGLISIVTTLIQFYALILLFTGKAKSWYNQTKI